MLYGGPVRVMDVAVLYFFFFFFSSRRRHTRLTCDWSSDVCSSDLHRDDGPLLQVDLGQHLALAGDDLARDHLGDFLQREFVPAIQADGWRHRLPFEKAGNYIMASHESDRGKAGERDGGA